MESPKEIATTEYEWQVPPDARRCKAKGASGGRCRKWAILGGTVCSNHGGSAPQVRRAAHLRLLEMADLAVDVHEKILRTSEDERVLLKAAEMVYDRTGLRPNPTQIDVGTSRDLLLKKLRQARGEEPMMEPLAPDPDAEIVDAEIVEDEDG